MKYAVNRPAWHDEARRLRELDPEIWTFGKLAERFGKHQSTVRDAVRPRARQCACGRVMDRQSTRCKHCEWADLVPPIQAARAQP